MNLIETNSIKNELIPPRKKQVYLLLIKDNETQFEIRVLNLIVTNPIKDKLISPRNKFIYFYLTTMHTTKVYTGSFEKMKVSLRNGSNLRNATF